MKELHLNDIKQIEFDILKEFKRFCNKEGISYFLCNGTLLGAIKYNGFIPWDDDVDVFVPREDYDRLIKTYQDSNKYRLFSVERNPKYRFTFAKLCDMTTVKDEENIDNGVQLGLDIDIFPLDSCTMHICKPRILKRIKMYQKGCVLSKFKTSKEKSFFKRCIIECCRKYGFNRFHNKLVKLIRKESTIGSTHKGCLLWPIYGEREIIDAEVFSDVIEAKFEGEKFFAPIGYDTYLRSLYGDYEQDPPLDKQKTHHNFKAYHV